MKTILSCLLFGLALLCACTKDKDDAEPRTADISGTYTVHKLTRDTVIIQDSAGNRMIDYPHTDTVFNTRVSYTDREHHTILLLGSTYQLDADNTWKKFTTSPGGSTNETLSVKDNTLYYEQNTKYGGSFYNTIITGTRIY